MEDSRQLLFSVDGFEVYSNSVYVIEGKPDYTAPSGFVEKGVTALPSADISKTYPGPFVPAFENSTEGVWDTGFYDLSPCYSNLPEKDRATISKGRKKYVLDKYKAFIGDIDALDHKDHKGWNKFKFILHLDRLMNTSNPKDLMDLYMSIHMGVLCPKGKERDHKYSQASYTVVDKMKQTAIRSTIKLSRFEAIETFSLMWANDRTKLTDILRYIGVSFSDSIGKGDLAAIFDDHIAKADNIERFNNIVEKAESTEGYTEIKLYRSLKELSVRGNGILTKSPGGKYFYKGFEIGPDLFASAKNINMSKEFLHIKDELVHLTDED